MAEIRVEVNGGKADLYTPYSADFVKAIKALGGARWNASKRCWTISEDMLPKARAIMMEMYGYTDEEQGETITVKVMFAKNVCEECDSVVILGKTVSRAYGRDTGAKPGEDVMFLEGTPTSGGSRIHWDSVVRAGSVVMLYKVSKALYDAKKDSLPDGVTVEIIECAADTKQEKREKTVDPALLDYYGDRAEREMAGEDQKYIEIVKNSMRDAYRRKAEAEDLTDKMMAFSFACGTLSCLSLASLITQASFEGVRSLLDDIFDD